MTAAWQELDEGEYDSVWNRFERDFVFKPSVRPEHWPGIAEPSQSETYGLSGFLDRDKSHYASLNAEIQGWALDAFRRLLPSESDYLYALDWQHSCYTFFPHVSFELDEFGDWTIPILPDGDYHIFLEREFKWGIFGHPWEQTLCVFGEQLLAILRENRPGVLSSLLRTDGLDA